MDVARRQQVRHGFWDGFAEIDRDRRLPSGQVDMRFLWALFYRGEGLLGTGKL
jgi:hypothetical protein